MKHKMIALLCTAAMTVGMLSACGQTESTDQKTSEASKSGETKVQAESEEKVEDAKNFNEEGLPIVDEEITLKAMINLREVDKENLPPKDIPLLQEISEKTGVMIDWEVVMESDWETKLNLMWASGEYPDIIFGDVDVEKYGVDEGVLLPVDDLLAKYVPNVTERMAMTNYDVTPAMRASDGQLYAVPYLNANGGKTINLPFINKTWLDELGLEMPTDLDSLTDALRAFKEKDPNGNGEADEIPIVGPIDELVADTLQMFGVPHFTWGSISILFIDDSKEVQYAGVQDGFRECVEWLHLLYEEGLLDPDAFTGDGNLKVVKLTDGVAGFFTRWNIIDTDFYNGAGKDSVVYLPQGTVISKTLAFATNKVFLTTSNEHPEATMRWVNELLEKETMISLFYGPKAESPETAEFPGWYYDDNGMAVTIPNTMQAVEIPRLNVNGIYFATGKFNEEFITPGASVEERWGYIERAEAEGLFQKYSNSYLNLCKFSLEISEEINRIITDLTTAQKEIIVQFVKNGVTDASWDDWLALCEDIGVKELLQYYQDALSKVDVE